MRVNNLGANKTELVTDSGLIVLFSYQTPVAAQLPSGRYVKTSKKWSRTTTKHITQWLTGVYSDVEEVEQSFIDNLV